MVNLMQFEILDYRREFCQYKTVKALMFAFLFVAVSACGSKRIEVKKVDATPVWFKTEKRFSMDDQNGNPKVHPFFDLVPFSSQKDNSVNYFLTTPIESKNYYDIDLVSGRLYKRHSYCEQADIWESYEGQIDKPKFAIGLVPRLLDQLGNPQKVVVFGNERYFNKHQADITHSQRTRVVGGVIHQYCDKYPCKTRDSWLSTLVLVGVNPNDPRYASIVNMEQLKKKVNWKYFKAFMENGFGRTKNGPFEAPAYRMVGEVPAKESLQFAIKKGHLFKFEEMRNLRNTCQRLYDYLWEGSKAVRTLTKERETEVKETKKKSDYLFVIESKISSDNIPTFENRFIKQEVNKIEKDEDLKKFKLNKKKYEDFSKFFFDFYQNYGKRYKTCMKFVKASSLSEDPARHWFFTFINGYMNLEKLDYIYRCNKRGWVENSRLSNGKNIFDLYARRNCSASSLDYAFDQVVTMNTGLRRAIRPYYRYVEYDYGVGGTHQKLQSWVYDDNKVISCADDDDRIAREKWEEKYPFRVFPLDLQWRRFTVE